MTTQVPQLRIFSGRSVLLALYHDVLRSQHPSPNVKTFCKFEPQIWLEIITSRDAKSACFKGSRTSCREIIFGIFWPNFGQKGSHHVMDASCRCLQSPPGLAPRQLKESRKSFFGESLRAPGLPLSRVEKGGHFYNLAESSRDSFFTPRL